MTKCKKIQPEMHKKCSLFFFWLCIMYCVWYGVEKQGFSIFSYINFLSATTEEAFIANARPYKFVAGPAQEKSSKIPIVF